MTTRTRTKTALGEMLGGGQLEPEVVIALFTGELPGYENLECYIYRLKPKPPDRPRDKPSYLWKMQTPFSLDDIKKRFGGGVFKCIANSMTEKDPVSGHRLNKADFIFEIDGPPIFAANNDLRETAAPAPAAPSVVVVPGQAPSAPAGRPFTIGGLQLTELKILKDLFMPSPANLPNPGAMELTAFLKGVEFARTLERGGETNELDIVKSIVDMLKGGAPAPADNGFIVSPGAAPAPVAPAPAAPPSEGQVQMTLDSLLNFLMDSYEEEKSVEDTATELLVMVPANYFKQMLAYSDAQVVATLKSWMSGFEFFKENAGEKEAWMERVVAAVRAGQKSP